MSFEPKNQKPDAKPGSDEIGTLQAKLLTPEQEEKIKGGLRASADDRISSN